MPMTVKELRERLEDIGDHVEVRVSVNDCEEYVAVVDMSISMTSGDLVLELEYPE